MGTHSLSHRVLLCCCVSLLFAAGLCHGSHGDKASLEVVDNGECKDCAESNFRTSLPFVKHPPLDKPHPWKKFFFKKPFPPIPIHKKPLLPHVPVYQKPLPSPVPPVPVYKKPLIPPVPVYKKPLHPPIPINKPESLLPLPKIPKKPCPPKLKVPPKYYYHHHPKFGPMPPFPHHP